MKGPNTPQSEKDVSIINVNTTMPFMALFFISSARRSITNDINNVIITFRFVPVKTKEAEYNRLKKMDDSIKKFLDEPDKSQPFRSKNKDRE